MGYEKEAYSTYYFIIVENKIFKRAHQKSKC